MASAVASLSSPLAMGVQWCVCGGGGGGEGFLYTCVSVCMNVCVRGGDICCILENTVGFAGVNTCMC